MIAAGTALLLLLVLTGCWDRLEIEERIFVLAVSVDKGKTRHQGLSDYDLTVQLAEPKALSGKTPSNHVEPVWNVSVTGPSLFDCMRTLATRVARVPFYEHLQVVIISEELAKEGVERPMDLFLRDHELRRKTSLIITQGKAKDVLEVHHKLLPVTGLYLSRLTKESIRKTAKMPRHSTIGTFSSNYRANRNSVLTRVEPRKNQVKMAGGAVLNKDKFAGWLEDADVRGYRWVVGSVQAGNYVVVNNEENGKQEHPINHTTYEVKNMRSIIKPGLRNGKPCFTVQIRSEGHIGEDGLTSSPTNEEVKNVEHLLNLQIKKDIERIVRKMQKQFGLDIFGFGEQMRRHEHAYWKKHEKEWDEVFKTAEVDIRVDTSVRRIGHVR
ncbi:Ger(x)C family spore germination protein [Paenibacillus doosanensis]|uniref:Ger(x)C family spore germination protein n=1 Tax=Paenibacillus doosanensis TaxID=1229154 RepID=UPI00217FEFB1|nr:Ger(x)C family spore germination protein [Paenibacillus doosanensis]MCS7461561.1 Ger(x)C family spore germination protein [Paenibacillus doosanensis]